MENIQLVIKNIETKEVITRITEFEHELDAIDYFNYYWDNKYFSLLSADEVFIEEDLFVGDEITIISADSNDGKNIDDKQVNYIGKKGIIQKIDKTWQWPYLIRFENEELNKPMFLWQRHNLRAI